VQLVNEIEMIFCNAERKAVQSHAHISQVQLNVPFVIR